MAYNLLNYPTSTGVALDTTTRHPAYRTTVEAATPDILVVEEIQSQAGVNYFLNQVMNVSAVTYSAGVFIDGPDTDNAIYFKTSKFSFIANKPITTALRNISEFKLVYKSTGDTLRIYAVHLKASSGSTNEALRAAEVDSLRKVTNALPAGSKFFVCGDFNFYSSNDPAYIKLLQLTAGNQGQFYDPITITGTWNNSTYAQYHTQSTRIRTFGGGSTGGMDDRFDLILYSKAVKDDIGISYTANSLKAFGNDGNHYNDSINSMPNAAVSQSVANGLHLGSDHLPVLANFTFPTSTIDMGAVAFSSVEQSPCSNLNNTLVVKVKNFLSTAEDFSVNPITVKLIVTDPNSSQQIFTKLVNSGILLGDSILEVTLTTGYNYSIGGTYTFDASTQSTVDQNTQNDNMPVAALSIAPTFVATMNVTGSFTICQGSSTTLTASTGSSYLWSNGSVTQSILVSTAGSYSVTVSNSNGCTATTAPVTITVISPSSNAILIHENMGTVSATTSIATHETNNGFENIALTMSGSGDVRSTNASSGYTGASGSANVFLTNTVGKNFIISGINTSGKSGLQLSFGLFRSALASTAADLNISVSIDGTNYTPLSLAAVTTTTSWTNVSVTGTIPQASNLRIQFSQGGTTYQYRIDDLVLRYSITPTITAGSSTTICGGDSVLLTASSGTNYLWSSGQTTQSIYVKSAGNYTVLVDCNSSAPQSVVVNSCGTITLSLTAFLQGFYQSGGTMQPILYASGLSTDPTACDFISVNLHNSTSPYSIVSSVAGILKTNGTVQLVFPSSLAGGSYYIELTHRNSLSVWSKFPVLFSTSLVLYDFAH